MGDMADWVTQGLSTPSSPAEIAYQEVTKLAHKFERRAIKKELQRSVGHLPWNDTTDDEWRKAAKETQAVANRLLRTL